jgi:hypothetical protein
MVPRDLTHLIQEYLPSSFLMQDLEINDYVDVMDRTRTWYVAQVNQMECDCVHVHFLGWADTNDEIIFSCEQDRIASVGTRTYQAPGVILL